VTGVGRNVLIEPWAWRRGSDEFSSFDLDSHVHENGFLPWRFESPAEAHRVDYGLEVIPIFCVDRGVEVVQPDCKSIVSKSFLEH